MQTVEGGRRLGRRGHSPHSHPAVGSRFALLLLLLPPRCLPAVKRSHRHPLGAHQILASYHLLGRQWRRSHITTRTSTRRATLISSRRRRRKGEKAGEGPGVRSGGAAPPRILLAVVWRSVLGLLLGDEFTRRRRRQRRRRRPDAPRRGSSRASVTLRKYVLRRPSGTATGPWLRQEVRGFPALICMGGFAQRQERQ